MIALTAQHRYFLYRRAVDMRKSFDGLSSVVRNELGRNPMDGEVYVFLNRQRSLIKLLVWVHNSGQSGQLLDVCNIVDFAATTTITIEVTPSNCNDSVPKSVS